ncbi:hypothetical protein HZS_4035 [Henneguya salminicola]|nr:hypothetical protein HZS_4035 [Henneguya salminicola]
MKKELYLLFVLTIFHTSEFDVAFTIYSSLEQSLNLFNEYELGLDRPYNCTRNTFPQRVFNLGDAIHKCWRAAIDMCWRYAHIRENEIYSSDLKKYLERIERETTQYCNKCLEFAENEYKQNCMRIFRDYHSIQSSFLLRLFLYF